MDLRPVADGHRARRMGQYRERPYPARAPSRQGPGRCLRPSDAAEEAVAAADAGPRQPAFPAPRPGHGWRRAATPSRQLCGRSGATEQRALACIGRPYRASRGHRLRPRDASCSGAQPAGGIPLHSRPSSATLRRPLARVAALDGAGLRDTAQHGTADARLAVGHLFRARLSLARTGASARGRR